MLGLIYRTRGEWEKTKITLEKSGNPHATCRELSTAAVDCKGRNKCIQHEHASVYDAKLTDLTVFFRRTWKAHPEYCCNEEFAEGFQHSEKHRPP